ncbi:hypothetical protein Ae201684_010845 [Aphanomyces euteiches]|uniref:Secreted protein n=1 Tax=Aphanomyces euteiches TaxID=100861 RepID=A0A6G0WWG1_9STRA|nr:hypothetical protein Ae201684_010845 [Aphanomyces euteiches]
MPVRPTFFLHSQQRLLFFWTTGASTGVASAGVGASTSTEGAAAASTTGAATGVDVYDCVSTWRFDMVFFQHTEHIPPLAALPKKPHPFAQSLVLSPSCCILYECVIERIARRRSRWLLRCWGTLKKKTNAPFSSWNKINGQFFFYISTQCEIYPHSETE